MYNSRNLYISLQETSTTGIRYSVYTLEFNKEHFLKVEVFVFQLVLYIINMLAASDISIDVTKFQQEIILLA